MHIHIPITITPEMVNSSGVSTDIYQDNIEDDIKRIVNEQLDESGLIKPKGKASIQNSIHEAIDLFVIDMFAYEKINANLGKLASTIPADQQVRDQLCKEILKILGEKK